MSIAHEYQGIIDAHRREMDRCLEEFDNAYSRQMEHFKEVMKKAEAAQTAPQTTETGLTDSPDTLRTGQADAKKQSAPTVSGQPYAASPSRRGKIRSIRIDR